MVFSEVQTVGNRSLRVNGNFCVVYGQAGGFGRVRGEASILFYLNNRSFFYFVQPCPGLSFPLFLEKKR